MLLRMASTSKETRKGSAPHATPRCSCIAVVEAQRCAAGCCGTSGLSLRQQYLAALLSFQHPQAPRGGGAGGGRGGPDAEALERRADWQAAFVSLYDSFRSGRCGAFYYVSPEGSARGFAAFFGAAGLAGRQRLTAILTRSSPGVRALLREALGHSFAAPLMAGSEAAGGAADEGSSGGGGSSGTQSMLVFEGALRVHGLFDFLLNESWRLHGDDADVPLLLSPAPFLHGCLRAAVPKVRGPGCVLGGNAAVGGWMGQQGGQKQTRWACYGSLCAST